MRKTWKIMIAVLSAAGILATGINLGCGGNDSVTVTETRIATITQTTASTAARDAGSSGGTDGTGNSGPIMPNVDESQVEPVTMAATAAYEAEWGDGSGVNVVWGPNIISGWALIGMGNNSGAAGKDVLLAQENGVWQVKDMGHALSVQWDVQTPAGLWPTM